jgi:hypothetical protein
MMTSPLAPAHFSSTTRPSAGAPNLSAEASHLHTIDAAAHAKEILYRPH